MEAATGFRIAPDTPDDLKVERATDFMSSIEFGSSRGGNTGVTSNIRNPRAE
jgi:hypothetical protein